MSPPPSELTSDELTASLSDVLGESRTLMTADAVLFGFLLNAVIFATFTQPIEVALLWLALFTAFISLVLFAMPVIYHHVQWPYRSKEKFIRRSHAFMLFGLAPFFMSLFFALSLAFYERIGYWSIALSVGTFAVLAFIYHERRAF